MRIMVILLICLSQFCEPALAQESPAPQVGDIIFQTDFEGPNARKGWSGSGKLELGYQSQQSLAIEWPEGSPVGGAAVRTPLPAKKLRGYLLHFSAMIRAEKVSEKPRTWNGIKFMVPIVAETGRLWPQGTVGTGTFDWKRIVFPVRVPPDAKEMVIHLGLESVTGKVWFDNIKVTVRKLPFVPKPGIIKGPIYKGHNLPRLRGAMVSPNVDEESLRVFGHDWKANLVRWQLVGWRPKGPDLDLIAYDRWLEGQLKKLDAALPLCEKFGLKVVVDLHNGPHGSAESGQGLFNSSACQEKFLSVWKQMAHRYRHHKAIWAYDLLNEPTERVVAEGLADWEDLAGRTARAIRAIDPQRAIIIEPPQGGNPFGIQSFNPIGVPNVVYSVHMYLPHSFTHQGVHGKWSKRYTYPGEIDGKQWDKTQLERALRPVVDFQERYRVHIYIGEFSAIRWAPDHSAYRYLRDLIDIFEAHDWDWSYHAFREWSGWSVEHGSDPKNTRPIPEPTRRKALLLDWFARNRKP